MRSFTVKDFVACNSPCFGCGELINFEIGICQFPMQTLQTSYLKPNVQKNFTSIDLHIGWNNTLILNIDHTTNKFSTNNIVALIEYLKQRRLFLRCECSKCHTSTLSDYLEFYLEKGFIKAVGLQQENTIMYDNVNMYQVYSHYDDNSTTVFVDRIDKTTPISPVRLDTPLIARSKFKNKEFFIKKIKTYILFS
jgi:hypothetical protein